MEPLKSEAATRAVRNLQPALRARIEERLHAGDLVIHGVRLTTFGKREFFMRADGVIEVKAFFGRYFFKVPVDLDCAVALAAGLAHVVGAASRGKLVNPRVEVQS